MINHNNQKPNPLSKITKQTEVTQDSLLWKSFKNGDYAAFELLYKKYFKVLVTYGFQLNSDRSLVEDAIHDLFVDLWRRKEFLSEVDNVKFYLFRAIRNQFSRNIQKDIFEGSENVDHFLDFLSTLSIEQESIEQESVQIKTQLIKKSLEKLSKRQTEAVHLRFYQGLSLDQTSQIMEIPKQVVKNLLSKSYAILRVSLRKAV
ncbi:RNA polymerase sigma factor [Flavobacterium acetivorans]|uniref:RNA polymerase sigma factor n=1 Tax=Flavobacterium acetivorans TaxID=2893883 RepID=UPI001E6163F5|nr:sigma-70 family RNA polymerase sigma factor [Flavobacterium sp. F-29]UFH35505.1 sigma-70 family RNA polymerase sigma factor [Flavobacterium sp. F-29]